MPTQPPRVVRPPEQPPAEAGEILEPADVAPGTAITVTGKLEKAGDANVSVTDTATQKKWTFGIAAETEILLNGKRATLSELAKDDAVRVTTLADDRSIAAKITAARAESQPVSRPPAAVVGRPAVRQPIAQRHAGLGVYVADAPQGVLVVEVDPGSPADGAVRHGDFVMQFDRRPVTTAHVLLGWIQERRPGDTVSLSLWRLGRQFDQAVTLADSNSARDLVVEDPALNLILAQQVRTQSNLGLVLRETTGGVQIAAIEPGSPAAQFGLRQGTVISSINGQPIASPFEFHRQFWTVGTTPGFIDLGLLDGATRRIDLSQFGPGQQPAAGQPGTAQQPRVDQRGPGAGGTGAAQPGTNQPGAGQPGQQPIPAGPRPFIPLTPPGQQPGQTAPAQPGQATPGQPVPRQQNPGQAGAGQARPGQTNPFRSGTSQP
ncbi:MAG: PDZ domain-containing protein [Planctomycetales bacterium]